MTLTLQEETLTGSTVTVLNTSVFTEHVKYTSVFTEHV